jgi:hypothetical protein
MMRTWHWAVVVCLFGCSANDPPNPDAVSEPVTRTSSQDNPVAPPLTKTDYFSIELPPGWTIDEVEEQPDLEELQTFSVQNAKADEVFQVTVAVDGPRFVQCFCAPWSEYHEYERDQIKYADLTMFDGAVRTLKAVGQRFGTDVHVEYLDRDKAELDRIVESIRPF